MGNHGIWVHPEEKGVNVNSINGTPTLLLFDLHFQ